MTNKINYIAYIGYLLFGMSIAEIIWSWYYSKKSNYNCNKCKNWDCRAKRCEYLRKKNENDKNNNN